MTATFETYTPTAFDFPTLPEPCRWSGGWRDGAFTIEVIAWDGYKVSTQRWDIDDVLQKRFPAQVEAAIALAAQRARTYAFAFNITKRYAPPPAAELWPVCPPPASNELR